MPPKQPTDANGWHRWFAVECNNEAWSLADQSPRSSAEDERMVRLAHAAALHWSAVGKEVHALRADVLLAWVHASAGQGDEACRYAERAASVIETTEGVGDWDRAFMPIAEAYAYHAAGDSAMAAAATARLDAARALLADDEDLKVFDHYRALLPKQGV